MLTHSAAADPSLARPRSDLDKNRVKIQIGISLQGFATWHCLIELMRIAYKIIELPESRLAQMDRRLDKRSQ